LGCDGILWSALRKRGKFGSYEVQKLGKREIKLKGNPIEDDFRVRPIFFRYRVPLLFLLTSLGGSGRDYRHSQKNLAVDSGKGQGRQVLFIPEFC